MTVTFLYTFPQWFVFAALFMIVYGWVENKKAFRLIGSTILILLGIFSVVVLLGDYLEAGNFLTPAEIAAEEIDDEIINEIPLEKKLLPAYWSFILASVLAIPAIILDWTDKKYARTILVVSALVALLGFFIVVGTVRTI